jgi:hypothetical protein
MYSSFEEGCREKIELPRVERGERILLVLLYAFHTEFCHRILMACRVLAIFVHIQHDLLSVDGFCWRTGVCCRASWLVITRHMQTES